VNERWSEGGKKGGSDRAGRKGDTSDKVWKSRSRTIRAGSLVKHRENGQNIARPNSGGKERKLKGETGKERDLQTREGKSRSARAKRLEGDLALKHERDLVGTRGRGRFWNGKGQKPTAA